MNIKYFKISIPHSYFKFQGVELLSKAQHKALANFSKKKSLIFNFSRNIFVHLLYCFKKFQFYELNLLMSILSFNQETFVFITFFIENSSIDKSLTKKHYNQFILT